jgi:hypothetical protein
LVPTSNTTSVSGADGDVSNMIAPVKSMIGDTLKLSWYFFDWITGDNPVDVENGIAPSQVLEAFDFNLIK